ncbi:hypothetical protein [Gordonia crocea]|uniref:Transmembrane protein n=1 Tax=Gordonia crocea TaxID=589162 RepID=A0A7I9UVQ0_9ACTN|nr:hypothetical protein [Gordonia crocea]GED97022.1 hypothetical protein nbrc107697_10610 [Gordonia crocea]
MTTDPTVRRAFIHGCVTVALASVAMVAGVAVTGTPRTLLLAACPLITLIGAVAAGVRTYRAWQADDRWPVWQGLLWFLLMTTLLLFMSVGPTVLGLTQD